VALLRLSPGEGDYFIFEVDGLDEDELLNLVKQSMELGYRVDSASELERQHTQDLPFLAQSRMCKLFERWNALINWAEL
jgi:hypothetical protein